jgi:hypothetical protein
MCLESYCNNDNNEDNKHHYLDVINILIYITDILFQFSRQTLGFSHTYVIYSLANKVLTHKSIDKS